MVSDYSKKVSTLNKLWLKWQSLSHEGDGLIRLKSPEFYGPVFDDCEPIEESGKIILDLTHHFLIHLPKPYQLELKWDRLLNQDKTGARFNEMTIQDHDLGKLSLLKNGDQIFIDCTDQTTDAQEDGLFKTAFPSMIFNSYDEPYDLSK